MDSEYFLKWNNHKSSVLSAVNQLFSAQRHADCILAAEGKPLRVHKLIVSACSPYLETLLEENLFEKGGVPIIVFNDVTFVELKALCEYMYKGEVNIPQEFLESFLKIAHTMKIRGLYDQGGGEAGKPPERQTPSPMPVKRKVPDSTPPQTPAKRVNIVKRTPAVTVAPVKRAQPKQLEETRAPSPAPAVQKWEPSRATSLLARSKSVSITQKEKPPVQPVAPQLQEPTDEELEAEYPEGYQEGSSSAQASDTLEFSNWTEAAADFGGNEGLMSEEMQKELCNAGNYNAKTGMYECISCPKAYNKRNVLKRHVQFECDGILRKHCPFNCRYATLNRKNMVLHIMNIHQDAK